MAFFETGAVGEVPPAAAGGTNFFRLAPMGANLGRDAISFVQDQLSPRLGTRPLRYAVAYVDDPYGRAVGGGAIDEIRERRLLMAAAIGYDAHSTDFAQLARRITSVRPDVLFVAAYVDDGVAPSAKRSSPPGCPSR